jgi:hypothetical protein
VLSKRLRLCTEKLVSAMIYKYAENACHPSGWGIFFDDDTIRVFKTNDSKVILLDDWNVEDRRTDSEIAATNSEWKSLQPNERDDILMALESTMNARSTSEPVAKRSKVARPTTRRSAPRSKESWRCIADFPNYEVSNFGRVRSLNRGQDGDVLKPEYKWRNRHFMTQYSLYRDGARSKLHLYALLKRAGFL